MAMMDSRLTTPTGGNRGIDDDKQSTTVPGTELDDGWNDDCQTSNVNQETAPDIILYGENDHRNNDISLFEAAETFEGDDGNAIVPNEFELSSDAAAAMHSATVDDYKESNGSESYTESSYSNEVITRSLNAENGMSENFEESDANSDVVGSDCIELDDEPSIETFQQQSLVAAEIFENGNELAPPDHNCVEDKNEDVVEWFEPTPDGDHFSSFQGEKCTKNEANQFEGNGNEPALPDQPSEPPTEDDQYSDFQGDLYTKTLYNETKHSEEMEKTQQNIMFGFRWAQLLPIWPYIRSAAMLDSGNGEGSTQCSAFESKDKDITLPNHSTSQNVVDVCEEIQPNKSETLNQMTETRIVLYSQNRRCLDMVSMNESNGNDCTVAVVNKTKRCVIRDFKIQLHQGSCKLGIRFLDANNQEVVILWQWQLSEDACESGVLLVSHNRQCFNAALLNEIKANDSILSVVNQTKRCFIRDFKIQLHPGSCNLGIRYLDANNQEVVILWHWTLSTISVESRIVTFFLQCLDIVSFNEVKASDSSLAAVNKTTLCIIRDFRIQLDQGRCKLGIRFVDENNLEVVILWQWTLSKDSVGSRIVLFSQNDQCFDIVSLNEFKANDSTVATVNKTTRYIIRDFRIQLHQDSCKLGIKFVDANNKEVVILWQWKLSENSFDDDVQCKTSDMVFMCAPKRCIKVILDGGMVVEKPIFVIEVNYEHATSITKLCECYVDTKSGALPTITDLVVFNQHPTQGKHTSVSVTTKNIGCVRCVKQTQTNVEQNEPSIDFKRELEQKQSDKPNSTTKTNDQGRACSIEYYDAKASDDNRRRDKSATGINRDNSETQGCLSVDGELSQTERCSADVGTDPVVCGHNTETYVAVTYELETRDVYLHIHDGVKCYFQHGNQNQVMVKGPNSPYDMCVSKPNEQNTTRQGRANKAGRKRQKSQPDTMALHIARAIIQLGDGGQIPKLQCIGGTIKCNEHHRQYCECLGIHGRHTVMLDSREIHVYASEEITVQYGDDNISCVFSPKYLQSRQNNIDDVLSVANQFAEIPGAGSGQIGLKVRIKPAEHLQQKCHHQSFVNQNAALMMTPTCPRNTETGENMVFGATVPIEKSLGSSAHRSRYSCRDMQDSMSCQSLDRIDPNSDSLSCLSLQSQLPIPDTLRLSETPASNFSLDRFSTESCYRNGAMPIGNESDLDVDLANNFDIECDLGDESDIESDLGNQSDIESDLGDESDIKSGLGDQSNIESDLWDQSNIDIDLGDQSNIERDLGDESNIESDLGDQSDIESDLGDQSYIEFDPGCKSDIEFDIGCKSDIEFDLGCESDIESNLGCESDIEIELGDQCDNESDLGDKSDIESILGCESDIEIDLGDESDIECDVIPVYDVSFKPRQRNALDLSNRDTGIFMENLKDFDPEQSLEFGPSNEQEMSDILLSTSRVSEQTMRDTNSVSYPSQALDIESEWLPQPNCHSELQRYSAVHRCACLSQRTSFCSINQHAIEQITESLESSEFIKTLRLSGFRRVNDSDKGTLTYVANDTDVLIEALEINASVKNEVVRCLLNTEIVPGVFVEERGDVDIEVTLCRYV